MLKRLLPRPARRFIRRFITELPSRLQDLPADLTQRDLPGAALRYNVAGTSSRRAFVEIGTRAAREIAGAIAPFADLASNLSVFDFGCGCGRVVAPLQRILTQATFCGADVDTAAVRWCATHLRGDFRPIIGERFPYGDAQFDVVYAVSIFTHMTETQQFAWLDEVARVLKRRGLFVATTHSPELSYARPDLADEERQSLASRGFAFVAGAGRFNENSAFHSAAYLRDAWEPRFELLAHQPYGLAAYQDLAVFRRA